MAAKLMHILRSTTLFKRLFVGFLLLGIPPVLTLNLFWYNTFSKEVGTLSTDLMESEMFNAKETVFTTFQVYESFSHTIYSDQEIIRLLKACIDAFPGTYAISSDPTYTQLTTQLGQQLYKLSASIPYISNIQIITPQDQYSTYDAYGNVKGGVIKDLDSFHTSEYYLDTLEAKGYPLWFDTTEVHDIFYRKLENSYGIADTLTLTRSIQNPYTDTTLGMIVMNINTSFLHHIFSSTQLSPQSNLIIMSPKSSITSLSSSPTSPMLSDPLPLLAQMIDSDSGSFSQFISNDYCMVNYVRIPHSEFYIANIMEHNILVDSALESASYFLILSAIWAIISCIFAYAIATSISVPVNRLKNKMANLSLDHLDTSIAITGHDEISILEEKFNEMTCNLKELIDKAYISELNEKELNFRKKNAELNALQMQINPHFLYNTLDVIRWEAMYQENGEGKVSKMIEDFSNFLRLSTKKSADFVKVEEEFNHVSAYLKVINYKFNDEISLTINCTFNPSHFAIPKLTLQPIIENTILHGFDGFEGIKVITINASIIDATMVISISDTGQGMSAETIHAVYEKLNAPIITQRGIGLYNVTERLKLYFDDNYHLSITSTPFEETTITLRFNAILSSALGGQDSYV